MIDVGMPPSGEKIRFPNLNALRFFAALAVILFHVELKKSLFGFPSVWGEWYFISSIGYHAVTFFFVLSGFLITYLLMKERDTYKTISIGRFYGRRVLRILPVYLLTLVVAFFVLPHFPIFDVPVQTKELVDHFWPALGLCLVFLSNVMLVVFHNLANVDQTWSVSTEEQFYLFWPLLMAWLPPRRMVKTLIWFIVVLAALRFAFAASPNSPMVTLLMLNRFGCMAIGGLGAIVVMNKPPKLFPFLTSKKTFASVLLVTALFLCFNIFPREIRAIQPDCYSVLFCILIINFSVGAGVKAPLDHPLLRLAGDCSYAAYMYHNIFIALGCNILLRMGYKDSLTWTSFANLALYVSVLVVTFLASWLSYVLMERPILRFKTRFSPIQSSS